MASSSRKAQLRFVLFHERARIWAVPPSGGPLVIAAFPTYSRGVQYFRAFALICFAFGLFVQVAAQASAMPREQTASTMDCSEMAQPGHGDTEMQPAHESGPCKTLECLIAMNCVPPIALAGPAAVDATFAVSATQYQPDGLVRLKSSPVPPESPPPQPALTA